MTGRAANQLRLRAHGRVLTRSLALARILDDPSAPAELLAEDLRVAMICLQRLTGVVDVEDILGEIFARFCIGR
jgi:tRNA modification GTPase